MILNVEKIDLILLAEIINGSESDEAKELEIYNFMLKHNYTDHAKDSLIKSYSKLEDIHKKYEDALELKVKQLEDKVNELENK